MKEITQEFHKKHRMPKSWASKQDVRSWFYGTKVLWLTTVWSICILPRDISYKKWNRLTTSPTTGAPSACLEGAHESQNEDCVAESCPCPGLCCPGNSSWDRPLKGTQNELICKKVLLVCVCHCVFAWVCLWGCVCMWQRFRVYRMTRLYTYHGPLTTWAALCILGVFFWCCCSFCLCSKKKPNIWSFRKWWTITVFIGFLFAISKNSGFCAKFSEFYAFFSNRNHEFMPCYSTK